MNKPGPGSRILGKLRKYGREMAIELTVNVALPYALYVTAAPYFGDLRALLASTAPPILWSGVAFARHRKVDVISMLVLAGISLSILAVLGGGSVQFLQLREKLVTVIIGLVFIGSVIMKRPLIYEIARANMLRKSQEEAARFSSLIHQADFRRTVNIMSLVCGIGLILDAVISAVLVFILSIPDYLIVGPILGYAWIGGLALWVFWYGARAKRLSEARQASEIERNSWGH